MTDIDTGIRRSRPDLEPDAAVVERHREQLRAAMSSSETGGLSFRSVRDVLAEGRTPSLRRWFAGAAAATIALIAATAIWSIADDREDGSPTRGTPAPVWLLPVDHTTTAPSSANALGARQTGRNTTVVLVRRESDGSIVDKLTVQRARADHLWNAPTDAGSERTVDGRFLTVFVDASGLQPMGAHTVTVQAEIGDGTVVQVTDMAVDEPGQAADDLVALARSVRPVGDSDLRIDPLPAGLDEAFHGDPAVAIGSGAAVDYGLGVWVYHGEGDGFPFLFNIAPLTPVEVRGHLGWYAPRSLMWQETAGTWVYVEGAAPRDELLQFAESLTPVSQAEWQAEASTAG